MGYTVKKDDNKIKTDAKINVEKPKKKVTKKESEKQIVKTGYFHKIKQELAKVKWPEAKDVFKYSIATLIFCVFLGAFFEGLNFLSSVIKGLFS